MITSLFIFSLIFFRQNSEYISDTSFLLFIFFYFLSNKIAIYFSIHKPSNSSEIVQNISSSINTLIIGLSFLLTFSFAFIGIGLFIVFIRSFFLKKG